MTITFLGTGTSQGVPVIACACAVCRSGDVRDNRLRTSVMVSNEKENVVIDSGPDFRQQMLRHQVSDIAGVVFTHEHKDHIAGLDDVRAFNYFGKKRMPVYCSDRVEEALRREYHYAFSNSNYPGVPEIDLVRIGNENFSVGEISFTPIQVEHMHMPVLGFRSGGFAYITDANFISETEQQKILGSEVLVLNALRKKKHPSHYSLDEAIDLIQKLNPRIAYLTHISHQLGKHAEIERELPENIRLAYDGLIVETS